MSHLEISELDVTEIEFRKEEARLQEEQAKLKTMQHPVLPEINFKLLKQLDNDFEYDTKSV